MSQHPTLFDVSLQSEIMFPLLSPGDFEVRRVPKFPEFYVTRHGEVWRKKTRHNSIVWTKMKGQRRSKDVPYLSVGSYKKTDKSRRFFYVHRAVLEAFVGPCPESMECRHLNGNPIDNRLENLQWGTHTENMQDKVDHNTLPRGVNHWKARLSENDVTDIRQRCEEGETHSSLAEKYKITKSAVQRIVNRKSWKHVL